MVRGVGSGCPAWPCLVFALVLLLAGFWPAASAQCDPSAAAISLTLEGLGTAFFEDFDSDPVRGTATLRGGICVAGAAGEWSVSAESAEVSGLLDGQELRVVAPAAVMRLGDWTMAADRLVSSGSELELDDVIFTGAALAGAAGRVVVELADDPVSLASDVRLHGRDFVLVSDTARLQGDAVVLGVLSVTTCACPGPPPYTVEGARGRLNLTGGQLLVEEPRLRVGELSVPLGEELELSEDLLAGLALPIALEYRPDRTGLGLLIPGLDLGDGLSLELGLLGLERDLRGYALARYAAPGVSFTVGKARAGPRADFSVTRSPAPGVEAQFAVRNRHERDSDYLHEGLLRLRATLPELAPVAGTSLRSRVSALAALSAQQLPAGPVQSPRLGVSAHSELALDAGGAGAVTFALDAQFTAYPETGDSQYGLRLRSDWRYRAEPLSVSLGHDVQWTDAGSPFGRSLDRLAPIHRVSTTAEAAGPLADGATGRVGAGMTYDLLRLGAASHRGLERLGAGAALEFRVGGWTTVVDASAELAGMLDPDSEGAREGYFEAGIGAMRAGWEVGSRFRYDLRPASVGLELLEARGAVPLAFEHGTMTPYLALDFAPTLATGEPPRVSGHGLVIELESCCGDLTLGYRQDRDAFVTSFALTLEH